MNACGSTPFYEALDPVLAERFEGRLPMQAFEKGAIVCHEGTPSSGFWFVVQGSVNIQRLGRDGRRRILETCGAGGVFGLVPVIDGGTYPATVVAREATQLRYCSTSQLHALVREAPEVGLAIARTFAVRLRRLSCEAADSCLKSVRARVAAHLLEDYDRAKPSAGAPAALSLAGSQEELASRIGTEREVFARALRGLRDDGVIEQERSSVRILDVDRLREIASG